MSDNVNHPDHYNQNGIECIDVIVAAIGVEGAQNFCIGNALKYIYRHQYKGKATEDIEKAVWYLNTWLSMQHRKENKSPYIIPDGYGGYTTVEPGCPFDESSNVFEYIPNNINPKDQSKETDNADN